MNFFSGSFFAGALVLAGQIPTVSMAQNGDVDGDYYSGNPINLEDFDFIVPSGLRHGQPSRNFYELRIGRNGQVVEITTLKNLPHRKYDDVAMTGLFQRIYPLEAAGLRVIAEIDYCVMSDGQSTFPCKIGFKRIGATAGDLAQVPGDAGFYKMDKFVGSPKIVKARLPKYPFKAAMKGMCGWVRTEFTLNHKGEARKIKILGSAGGGIFIPSVVEALRNFRFERDFDKAKIEYLITFEIPGKCFLESNPN